MTRKLKVYKKYVPRNRGYMQLPEIRLCGLWLHSAGFFIGEEVIIEQSNSQIIIKVANTSKNSG